jgi:hypothetical protein
LPAKPERKEEIEIRKEKDQEDQKMRRTDTPRYANLLIFNRHLPYAFIRPSS